MAPVISLAISISMNIIYSMKVIIIKLNKLFVWIKYALRPMQWFTPTIGFFQSWATVRATHATEIRAAPIPGPFVKHTTSISFGSI